MEWRGRWWLEPLLWLVVGLSGCGGRTGPWSIEWMGDGVSVAMEPGGTRAAFFRRSAMADGFPVWTLRMMELHTRLEQDYLVTEEMSRQHGLAGDPPSIAFAPNGEHIAILDASSNSIKMVEVATRTMTTFAGGIGGSSDGQFSRPMERPPTLLHPQQQEERCPVDRLRSHSRSVRM